MDMFYEKDGDEYVLVSVEDRDGYGGTMKDILWRGREVAIGFTFDPESDRGIRATTHRHGSPETVQKWLDRHTDILRNAAAAGKPLAAWAQPRFISSDQWPIEELNKILNITGYLEIACQKLGITLE